MYSFWLKFQSLEKLDKLECIIIVWGDFKKGGIYILKTCGYCKKIHDTKIKCGAKKKYYREKNSRYNKSQEYQDIIKSNRWKKLSALIKSLDNHECLICKDCGLISPKVLEVHHIEKVMNNFEKAFDEQNLITLCIFHHKQAEQGIITIDELLELINKYRNNDVNNDILTI